jgi:hypothetical protein
LSSWKEGVENDPSLGNAIGANRVDSPASPGVSSVPAPDVTAHSPSQPQDMLTAPPGFRVDSVPIEQFVGPGDPSPPTPIVFGHDSTKPPALSPGYSTDTSNYFETEALSKSLRAGRLNSRTDRSRFSEPKRYDCPKGEGQTSLFCKLFTFIFFLFFL